MDYPGNLFVVAAPSGAGKSSLVRALQEQGSGELRSIEMPVQRFARPVAQYVHAGQLVVHHMQYRQLHSGCDKLPELRPLVHLG